MTQHEVSRLLCHAHDRLPGPAWVKRVWRMEMERCHRTLSEDQELAQRDLDWLEKIQRWMKL